MLAMPERKYAVDITTKYTKEYSEEEKWFIRTKTCIEYCRDNTETKEQFLEECKKNNIKISDTEGFLKIWWVNFKQPKPSINILP